MPDRAIHRPIVTVASEHGAGGDVVAPFVADALGVPFLDRALPAALATATAEAKRPSGLVGTLARTSTMLAGEPVERVDLNEGSVRAELAEFLAPHLDRRRRGTGPRRVRPARRSARGLARAPEREPSGPGRARGGARGLSAEAADRRERDRARKEYVRRAFGVDPDDRTLYHLVIDTIAVGTDASVELVLTASQARIRQR